MEIICNHCNNNINNKSIIKLDCNHNYHYKCYINNLIDDIDDIKNNAEKCPTCNKEQKLLENNKNKDCPICFQNINQECEINIHCSHIFHRSCLSNWYEIKKNCPMCRVEFNDTDIKKILNINDTYDFSDNIIEINIRNNINRLRRMNENHRFDNDSDDDSSSSNEAVEMDMIRSYDSYINNSDNLFEINDEILESLNTENIIPIPEQEIIEVQEEEPINAFEIMDEIMNITGITSSENNIIEEVQEEEPINAFDLDDEIMESLNIENNITNNTENEVENEEIDLLDINYLIQF
jgi:hypothetical protein